MKSILTLLIAALINPVTSQAGEWAWDAGQQTNNGSITVKSVNGAGTYSGTQNPTGAAARTNQNAVTQPPVVVMQATALLPIKVRNTACVHGTDRVAVTADMLTLLTCPVSNLWTANLTEGNVTADGNLTVLGNVILGNATSDTVVAAGNAAARAFAPTLQVADGDDCAAEPYTGLIARDSAGASMNCMREAGPTFKWRKAGGNLDSTNSQSYTWNDLNVLGYDNIAGAYGAGAFVGNHQIVFTIPFGTSTKDRFVSMNTIQQYKSNAAGGGAFMEIRVNGESCGSNRASHGNAGTDLRLSTSCLFKIPANTGVLVEVEHTAGMTTPADLQLYNATIPMVTYFTTSN